MGLSGPIQYIYTSKDTADRITAGKLLAIRPFSIEQARFCLGTIWLDWPSRPRVQQIMSHGPEKKAALEEITVDPPLLPPSPWVTWRRPRRVEPWTEGSPCEALIGDTSCCRKKVYIYISLWSVDERKVKTTSENCTCCYWAVRAIEKSFTPSTNFCYFGS